MVYGLLLIYQTILSSFINFIFFLFALFHAALAGYCFKIDGLVVGNFGRYVQAYRL